MYLLDVYTGEDRGWARLEELEAASRPSTVSNT